jgi:hypothetical protein
MRRFLGAAVVVLLASPLVLHAADVRLGSCEGSVGAWDFATKEGGRAVIAKEGSTYHAVWITTFVNTNGETEPEGVAADCICQDAPNKLVWKCRVAFSLQSNQTGAEQTFEWTTDGRTLTSWYIGPDGTRSGTAIRRPK